MTGLDYTVVPITRWPAALTAERQRTPFSWTNDDGRRKSGPNWSTTKVQMARELKHLEGTDVVLQMAVRPQDIRRDGEIKGNARPAEHPGVILTFDSKYGRLSYPCDTFADWKSNLRAIIVALESLRRVDRYKVTRHGEQYTGSRQITAKAGVGARDPYEVLAKHSGLSAEAVAAKPKPRKAYILAVKATHPDRGGDPADFDAVNAAGKTLGVA